MEIPINASLGNKGDGADVGPMPEGGGGGFGSRSEEEYRKMLDEVYGQVIGKRDFDNAYATFTIAARSHVKLGMPARLMYEYQDKLSERYARLQEPVPSVQHIDQNISIAGNNTGPFKGNIGRQDLSLGHPKDDDSTPKLIE